ncbi:hypothetical protein F5B21DRAFT_467450 [Xylaria acuta]|nr:hypothetical protein F5B21DRAFT_467450 [Xylaria acuta]
MPFSRSLPRPLRRNTPTIPQVAYAVTMSHIKESNIHPVRRDSRHGGSDDSRPRYLHFTCPACGEQFSSRAARVADCPNCASLATPYYTSIPNASGQNSARPRQSAARSGAISRSRNTFPDAYMPVNRRTAERIERRLPSIRDVPILRRALDTEVPSVRDPAQQGHSEQYPSLRSGQDDQPDLPPLRARQAAQHDRGAEHQQRQVLPDPRDPYSRSRTDQRSDPSGHICQSYHHYYDEEYYKES